MFNEQLAVLLLVMANHVPNHASPGMHQATSPDMVASRNSLQLKMAPRLITPPVLNKFQRVSNRRQNPAETLVASY